MLVGVCARAVLLYMTHSMPSASWILNLIARLCTVLNVVFPNCVLFKSLLGLTANLQLTSTSIKHGLRGRLEILRRSVLVSLLAFKGLMKTADCCYVQ